MSKTFTKKAEKGSQAKQADAPGKRAHKANAFSRGHAEANLLSMQRTYGNRFVTGLLKSAAVAPDGAGSCPAVIQRKATGDGSAAQGEVESHIRSGGGQPLDPSARSFMESRFGADFGSVRVHADANAAEAADALSARAFTVGRDIYFGGGEYQPATRSGMRLLGHELAHVVQQGSGIQASGISRSGDAYEVEAERAAEDVSTGRDVQVGLARSAPGVQRVEKAPEKKKEEKGGIGSFFESIGRGIASAGKAIWHGLKVAGSAVWEGMKAVGRGIATVAGAVWTGIKWIANQLWDKVTATFERIAHWIANLPKRVGRLLLGLWEGVKSLKPWSLEWWKSLGSVSTWKDFLKWIGARFLELLEVGGIGEIYETVTDFIKFNTRKLTGTEVKEASRVFGSSINLSLVRVDEWAVLGPAFSKREYTSFHLINGWGGSTPIDVMIHELTHVWQYEQSGAIYMPQAIHSQVWGAGYVYQGAAGLQAAQTAGKKFGSFQREQQAQIVHDFYRLKNGMATFDPSQNPATSADLPLYAQFVAEASTLPVTQLLA